MNTIPQIVDPTKTFVNKTKCYVPMHGFHGTMGDALFGYGYRVWAKDACSLIVKNCDGAKYVVHLYDNTCTCKAAQFGNACKHRSIDVLTDLVFLSVAALDAAGRFESAGKLLDVWSEYAGWKMRQGGAGE